MLRTTSFTLINPFASLPRLLAVGHERQASPSYWRSGRLGPDLRYCTFQYTIAGAGEFEDTAGRRAVPVGSGFLVRFPTTAVTYRYPCDGSEPWEFLWCQFDGGGSEAVVDELIARFGPVLRLAGNAAAVRRLQRFDSAIGATMPLAASEGAALVQELLVALAAQPPDRSQTAANRLIRQAFEIIRRRYAGVLTTTDLARELDVSREHLTRTFSAHLGMTPHDCILEERISRACQLLRGTAQANKAIARTVGLPAVKHFAQVFRRVTGLSPQAYRDQPDAPLIRLQPGRP
jgi:AraC-like DNA-binding protein